MTGCCETCGDITAVTWCGEPSGWLCEVCTEGDGLDETELAEAAYGVLGQERS